MDIPGHSMCVLYSQESQQTGATHSTRVGLTNTGKHVSFLLLATELIQNQAKQINTLFRKSYLSSTSLKQGQPGTHFCTVSLGHSRALWVYTVRGCLYTTVAELSSCDKSHMVHEAESIYSLALQRENLLIPALQEGRGMINPNARMVVISKDTEGL